MRLPRKEGLNIIPFIDIMLVLLAIVLSISTFIVHGNLKIQLPSMQSAQSEQTKQEKITISVDASNEIYLNDRKISLAELNQEFSKIPSTTFIELRHDKESKFEAFISIIDVLKKNNHENFSIATTLH